MHTEREQGRHPPAQETIDRGYEPQPLNLRPFIIGLVASTVLGAILLAVLCGLMFGFETVAKKMEPAPQRSPLATTTQPVMPQPWLQPSPSQPEPRQPWQDMQAFNAYEDELLASYSTSEDGSVRIPIERAMQIMGARAGATTKPAGGRR